MSIKTLIVQKVHSGAEVVTDALSGFANTVGPNGIVEIALASSKAENKYTVKILETGTEIVPEGSAANLHAAADSMNFDRNAFIFRGDSLLVGGTIIANITAAAASESMIAMRTS